VTVIRHVSPPPDTHGERPSARAPISRCSYLLSFLTLGGLHAILPATTESTLTPFRSFTYMPYAATTPRRVGGTAHSPQKTSAKRSPSACKPFVLIFLAHPHPLTPIESYSCKNHGGGGARKRQIFSRSPGFPPRAPYRYPKIPTKLAYNRSPILAS